VWTPLDDDVLWVDDAHGRTLGVDVLSRGTREQLFLALRLALVEQFARRGARLPVVLDDVLVNFDRRRAAAAARALAQFAAGGQQVIVFTCHRHTVRMLRRCGASVVELPDNAGVGAVCAAERGADKPAREALVSVASALCGVPGPAGATSLAGSPPRGGGAGQTATDDDGSRDAAEVFTDGGDWLVNDAPPIEPSSAPTRQPAPLRPAETRRRPRLRAVPSLSGIAAVHDAEEFVGEFALRPPPEQAVDNGRASPPDDHRHGDAQAAAGAGRVVHSAGNGERGFG
jgi:hypothetical protein